MTTSMKTTMLTLCLTMLVVLLWNIIFYDQVFISTIGTSIFPIIIGSLSSFWVFKATKVHSGKEKLVWILFFGGLLIHVTGNLVWLITVVSDKSFEVPNSSYFLFIFAYYIFLSALVTKLRIIRPKSTTPYFFNSTIFIIVITTILIQYLIEPYWESAENFFQLFVFGLMFPLVVISIILIINLLYYHSRYRKDRVVVVLLMIGFYLQIIGDINAAIMTRNNHYYQVFIEPMWVGALLLIGFAGLHAKKYKVLTKSTPVTDLVKESLFPYLGTFILIILLFDSYDWQVNILSISLGIVLIIVTCRQLLVMHRNGKLMIEYRRLAYHDQLTGLKNRSSFQNDLDELIEKSLSKDQTIALILIDLDQFKFINDTLGHFVGDHVLSKTTKLLKNVLDSKYPLYRIGGDEFVVIVKGSNKNELLMIVNQVITAFGETQFTEKAEMTITPSVGISIYPDNGRNRISVFKAAETAMYAAKQQGRSNYHFYDSVLDEVL